MSDNPTKAEIEARFAREDAAFSEWMDLRTQILAEYEADREVQALIRSAFHRGVRFGLDEAQHNRE